MEFHNIVDEDEHGIIKKSYQRCKDNILDEELGFIDTNGYEFAGFHEDERKRMLKELSRTTKCSHGEVKKKRIYGGSDIQDKGGCILNNIYEVFIYLLVYSNTHILVVLVICLT